MTPSLLLLLLLLFLCTLYACAFTPTAPYFRKLSKLPIANGLSRSSLPLFSTFDNEDGEHDEDDEDEDEDDGPSSDGLEMLLVDADKFRRKRPLSLKDTGETRGGSTSSNVKDIISTIVTADFFLICFFLLWFVTGAILSIAGVGDGVQIAFNGIFQPVVQPALGVLMIGAVAGGLGNDGDKKEQRFDGFDEVDEK